MPSVVHAPLLNPAPFMFKDRTAEPLVSAFTAVNGTSSPPAPRDMNGAHAMSAEPIRLSPISRSSPDQAQDQKPPLASRDDWGAGPRSAENARHNGIPSLSPTSSEDGDTSPNSPGKRKRSSSLEEDSPPRSPDGSVPPSRRRLNSYVPMAKETSSSAASHVHMATADHAQRTLPPMERAESERTWPPRDSQEVQRHGSYPDSQLRDLRTLEPSQEGVNHNSISQPPMSAAVETNGVERSSTTEITRAGVQVDPKKRKRQFANRTKTGCGTCRRRKKKCDEAKPDCNNCQRGGFICEGYANKIPWPKNGGATKPHPPLQAKDRFPVDPAQLYHNHGTARESYPDPSPHNGTEGVRNRPIVVEEHDRSTPRNGWGSNWGEPPRASYPPEHHPPQDYPHAPASTAHPRPPSNDHHVPHPTQGPPSQRQHNPRIYHHTPQTMSQVVGNSPAVTAEAALHHQSQPPHQQPSMAPPTVGPPAPPPSHYHPPPPPRPQRSEKDKMLNEEPFKPYDDQLVEERERCKGAIFRFNNTSNNALEIARDERDRHFRSILAARWTQQYRGRDAPMVGGHLGHRVFVDTPFMCDYGYNISIGDSVDIGTGCKFLDSGRITIGRNTTVCANVTIDTQKTPNDHKSLKGSGRTTVAAAVHIGENVHIGANSTILAGVKIGTGAIIHAGSVVVRDVPRDVVVRGNPAEVRSVHWED